MREKILRKIWEKLGKIADDNKGQTLMMAGIILIALIAGGFFLLTWMILANLTTIGKGILYIAIAMLVMVGVAILAKRYIFPKGVR